MYASKELSEELFGLSGWTTAEWYQHDFLDGHILVEAKSRSDDWVNDCPAYTAGFLLRRLPFKLEQSIDYFYLLLEKVEENEYIACYSDYDKIYLGSFNAETAEEALCKLAIKLFKEGILQKEVNK